MKGQRGEIRKLGGFFCTTYLSAPIRNLALVSFGAKQAVLLVFWLPSGSELVQVLPVSGKMAIEGGSIPNGALVFQLHSERRGAHSMNRRGLGSSQLEQDAAGQS